MVLANVAGMERAYIRIRTFDNVDPLRTVCWPETRCVDDGGDVSEASTLPRGQLCASKIQIAALRDF